MFTITWRRCTGNIEACKVIEAFCQPESNVG